MRRGRRPNFVVVGTYETISDDDEGDDLLDNEDGDGSTTSPPSSNEGEPRAPAQRPFRYVRDEATQAQVDGLRPIDHSSGNHHRHGTRSEEEDAEIPARDLPHSPSSSPSSTIHHDLRQQEEGLLPAVLPPNIERIVAQSHRKQRNLQQRQERSDIEMTRHRTNGADKKKHLDQQDGRGAGAVLGSSPVDPVLAALQQSQQRSAGRNQRDHVANWIDHGRRRGSRSPKEIKKSPFRDMDGSGMLTKQKSRQRGDVAGARGRQDVEAEGEEGARRSARSGSSAAVSSSVVEDRLGRMEKMIESLQNALLLSRGEERMHHTKRSASPPVVPERGHLVTSSRVQTGAIDGLHQTLQEIRRIEAKPFLDKWREVSEYYAKVAENPALAALPHTAASASDWAVPVGTSEARRVTASRDLSSSPARRAKLYEGYASPIPALLRQIS